MSFRYGEKTMKINSKTTAMIGVFGVMMLGLTACGGDKNQEKQATQTSKAQQSIPTELKKYHITT